MKIDKTTILKIARLSNLPIEDAQIPLLISQFQETLDTVKILEEIDTKGVEPSFSASEKKNIFREDVIRPSLPVGEVLKNAKRKYKNYFVCDQIKHRK